MAFYSQRMGLNANVQGFDFEKIKEFMMNVYTALESDGYFDEAFGKYCVDNGQMAGTVVNPEMDIVMNLRKQDLWPIHISWPHYSEADLFDMIEYLFQKVSKPIDGTMHAYSGCGMHWNTFNKKDGQEIFRNKANEILALYVRPFELSVDGEVLEKPPTGFEVIFAADLPTKNETIIQKVEAATHRYRRHGATYDDRRAAVRDLADILEYLRPQVKTVMGNKDESALFDIANNFAIRHLNKSQQSDYGPDWLSWMFYLYLSTVHLVVRRIEKLEEEKVKKQAT